MSLSNLSAVVNADAEGTKIPLKFLPLVVTRHGASYYKFNAQLDHPNAVERVFLVEEYLGVHDLLEPTIVQTNSADRHTQVGLCNRYNIARRSFRNWLRKYRKEGGAGSFYDYSGRPKDFDGASTEVVINQIRDRKKYDKKDPVLKSQLNLLLVAAKKDTLARKGKKRKVEQDVTVSVNTEKRFKTAHNIRLRKPKDESHARDKAERSFRCTYKFACLLFAFAADKHAEHKWNADATTFEYKPSGANDYALILGNDADRRSEAVVEPEEMDHMRAMMPLVVKEFYAHGRASDDFLDSIGVAADFHGESRDDLTLARQDAQLLTHTDTVARYKEYQLQKELAQDPVHIALMKVANEDERLLKKEAKQQVKLAEKTALIAAKAEAKAAEQLRVKSLTKQERTLEVAARKEASKLARDRKANDAAQRLEEARSRLGPEKVASLLASVQLGTKTPSNSPPLLVEPTQVESQRKDRMLKEPKHTLEVTKPSLSSLCEPLSWLTSGILDAAHNLLMQEVHAQRPDYRMHIHLCAVHSHLHRGALDIYEHQASLAFVGTNLFDLDMLLFPVNHSNNHWTLIAVQPQSKTITYLDSLAPKCARSKKAIQAIEVVQQYLQHEAEYCHVQFNKKTWAVEVPGRAVPQQNNGSDCGMFVYIFARHLTLDIPLSAIRAIDMPQHRRSLATTLSTGQLSPVLQLGYAGTDVISL